MAGQSTTDFATTYGAMETFELQHTGLTVGFPKAHIIRPSGDITPGPVIPDMTIALDPSDQGDAMLETLIKHITDAKLWSPLLS